MSKLAEMLARGLPFLSVFFGIFILISMQVRTCLAKECTNIPEQSSHTLRSIATDDPFTYIRSLVPLHNGHSSAPSAKTTEDNLPSRQLQTAILHQDFRLRPDPSNVDVKTEEDKSARQRPSTIYSPAVEGRPVERHPALKEVSLHRVRLDADSLQGIAQETNLQFLLMLDVDSLVYSFRVTAGLPSPGSPYGGWESPNSELRGHFVGHYMSAAAMTWASTHNFTLQEKMAALIVALGECQDQMGTGYMSAFPSEFFDRFEAIEPVWAPYYTIHKIMAGLLDQYNIAGNEKALEILLRMAEYFLRRVESVIKKFTIERHWNSLNEEVGGMNDVLYRLFTLTGNPDHLKLAHLFDKPCFLGLLSLQTDGLSGFHTNTHIPLVVGAQMRFEVTGDKLYGDLSEYFLKTVNSSHRYATGGTSVSEFWTKPHRNGDALSTETQETCTTYNMLKVARNLFRWTNDISYADYYERTIVNGILGIQRGKDPGVMIYMLPEAPGSSKAISYHGWGTPYNSFWCCYGTGVESFSKLGDSIYYEDNNPETLTLRVAQYVSSNLSWDAVGLVLSQKVAPLLSNDPYLNVTFNFYDLSGETGNEAELSLRIPKWTTQPSQVTLNGFFIGSPLPGKYFTLPRIWRAGDILQVDLCISLSLEKIQDDRQHFSSLHAILFGPYLLAGMTEGEHEIQDVNTRSLSSWIIPVPASAFSQLYSFSQNLYVTTFLDKPKDSDVEQGSREFYLRSARGSVGLTMAPSKGSNEAAECTFLLTTLFPGDFQGSLLGRMVSFELYSSPGHRLVYSPGNMKLAVVNEGSHLGIVGEPFKNSIANLRRHQGSQGTNHTVLDWFDVFKVKPGLSGDENSVSFEAATMPGCFVSSDIHGVITLQCQHMQGEVHDSTFYTRASFTVNKGLASYNPVSFIAKGKNRSFLLFPLHAYLDEKYATYFNLTSS